jgi:Tol biopolymer transport system component
VADAAYCGHHSILKSESDGIRLPPNLLATTGRRKGRTGPERTKLRHRPATPDGRSIAPPRLDIHRASSDEINLSSNPAADYHPAWSPDGSKIAFQTDRTGNGVEVFVMNADGSSPVNLTNDPGSFNARPAWSPDGARIAFTSGRDGNLEIYVMNADGSGQTRLTNDPELDSYPVWSPDGGFIGFRSDRDGNIEVFGMAADGSNQQNLTQNAATDCHPTWSSTAGALVAGSGQALAGRSESPRQAKRPSLGSGRVPTASCLGE